MDKIKTGIVEHNIAWTDEQISRLWNYYSKTSPYKDVYFAKLFGEYLLRKTDLPFSQNINVLDFGCGPGFIWDHLQRLNVGWRYSALDFSKNSVDSLFFRAANHPKFGGAQFVEQLPCGFDSSEFDAVLLFEVVEHLNDSHLNSTLNEISRLLKPGGVLVISTPNSENLSNSRKFCPECGAIFHEWQHIRSWNPDSLRDLVCSHGFNHVHTSKLDFRASGMTPKSLVYKMARIAKVALGWGSPNPHMVSLFSKPLPK